MRYKIIEGENQYQLTEAVNTWIHNGYAPIGSPIYRDVLFGAKWFQAVYLPEQPGEK